MCKSVSWFAVFHGESRTIYISENTDSHTAIAEEFGIKDDGVGRVCAGEFYPDPKNAKPDTSTWLLVWDYLDVSRRPDWMSDEMECGLRAELERRCKAYVVTDDRDVTITRGRLFVFGSPKITQSGGEVHTYDTSAPKITKSGGVVWTYGPSALHITKV